VVPEATYKRRTRLTPSESERTERLARVIAAAEYVWNDRDDAREWLTKPHPELENRPPLEAALTELGARRAEEVLDRLFYAFPLEGRCNSSQASVCAQNYASINGHLRAQC